MFLLGSLATAAVMEGAPAAQNEKEERRRSRDTRGEKWTVSRDGVVYGKRPQGHWERISRVFLSSSAP